jgi:16S rRNA (guanine966-N2)-methyltransferase
MFNALASLDLLRDARMLDLFAGSGALGIEALSRGAAECTFVEQARPALLVLRANLDALDLAARATVLPMDVDRYLAGAPPLVDLALADPPYAFDGWGTLLARVPAPFLVAESDRPIDPGPGWEVIRAKRYGVTHVTFLQRSQVYPGLVMG